MPGPSTGGMERFGLGVFFPCTGVAAILYTFTASIAFIPGAIRKRTLPGKKTLALDTIRGCHGRRWQRAPVQWPGIMPQSMTSVMPITMILVHQAITFHRLEFL